MGWDDFNYDDDDRVFGMDYIDYMNHTGIYDDSDIEDDPEDDLYLFGLDPDELDSMDDDERRSAIEDAGLDPDDYDFSSLRSVGKYTQPTTATKSTNRNTPSKPNTSGKWSLIEFIIMISILCIIGYTIAAIGGELLATIIVIIIGVIVCNS